MFTDALNLFSDQQALTATAASTNTIDFGVDRNMGQGEPLALVLVTDVAADFTTGDETYRVDLQTDDNDSFSSLRAVWRRDWSATYASELAAGTKIVIPLPHDNERYVRVNYTLGGTTPTWTVTAFLQPMSMIQADEKYADAIVIS